MRKRLLAGVALAGLGVGLAMDRFRRQQAERELWREATDPSDTPGEVTPL